MQKRRYILRLVFPFALLTYFSFTCRAVTCTSFGSPITADQAANDLRSGTTILN
jgi:hypothetical protein